MMLNTDPAITTRHDNTCASVARPTAECERTLSLAQDALETSMDTAGR